MTFDFLILGQGICGTLLSHALLARGARILVVADPAQPGSSQAAAGIINPVGGKRLWRTRHMQATLPDALRTYQSLAEELSTPPPASLRLMMFHENEDRCALFAQRMAEEPELFENPGDDDTRIAAECFQTPLHSFGMIQPYYQVDSRTLLSAWRQKLDAAGLLLKADFDWSEAAIRPEGVAWRGMQARKLIACDGAAVRRNALFGHLRWTPNKGEALILSIPHLPGGRLYQHGIRLVPWGDGLWWAGTRQTWDFADAAPTAAWRTAASGQLRQWLRLPFEVVDHLAAERPTIAGQQPVAALHPQLPALGIFNGMGSRGFANAPFYAERFAESLTT